MQIPSRPRIQSDMICNAAGCAKNHRLSDFNLRFMSRLNYAVVSAVLATLPFVAPSATQARMINAASVSLSDVRRALASAADGDTVIVPAGTASWTSGLSITKGITIQGQSTTSADNGTADDQTVLVDNIVHVPGDQGFFHCRLNTGQTLRISGITFTGVGGRSDTMYNGAIRLSGSSDQVRIDHCHFIALKHQPTIEGDTYGVSDHNVWTEPPSGCQSHKFFNGTPPYGDAEFAMDAGWGGSKFFFVEDCYIKNTIGTFNTAGGIDAGYGGKFVVRHCHLFNVEILCHGTELDRSRGGRAQEIYNNDYHWSFLTTMDGIRSGSLLVHDNTYFGVTPRGYGLQTYRLFNNYGSNWQGASGDNNWDVNVTEADGTHVDGHPPYLFQSGTVTGGSENAAASLMYLTDTSKHWAPNQWAYYTARKLSDNRIGQIISNTSNTLTMRYYTPDGINHPTLRAGDQYKIHKVLVALDQPGRGRGNLIARSTNPPAAWPNQEPEPCYSWNNIHSPGGEHINFAPAVSSLVTLLQGRDYFNDTALSGYTPFTYPHPLVTGIQPRASTTLASPRDFHRKEKTEDKKATRKRWGHAKENSAYEMTQPNQ